MPVSRPLTALPLAALLLGAASSLALAQTNNVVIDNLVIAAQGTEPTITFKRIEATNTNLSREELTKLFSGAASKEEAGALIKKMKADRIAIPEVTLANKEGRFTLTDFAATGVNDGAIRTATLRSIEGKSQLRNGDVTFQSGAIEAQGLGLGTALNSMISGSVGDGDMQIGKLTWAGFRLTAPDSAMRPDAPGGNLYKISLAGFTAEGTYDGAIPKSGKAEAKNLVVEPPKGSPAGQGLAALGYDKVDIGFVGSGTYDRTKRTYAFDNLTISGVNMGALGFKVLLGNIDPVAFTGTKAQKNAAYLAGDVASLSIRYDNQGLFEKAVDFLAKQQKKAPEALRKEWSAMATAMLPMLLGGDPAAQKLGAAVGKFIEAPKTITITARAKGAPVKFTDFTSFRAPADALARIELDAAAGP